MTRQPVQRKKRCQRSPSGRPPSRSFEDRLAPEHAERDEAEDQYQGRRVVEEPQRDHRVAHAPDAVSKRNREAHGWVVIVASRRPAVLELDLDGADDGRAECEPRGHPRADIAHHVVSVEVDVVGDVGRDGQDDAAALSDRDAADTADRLAVTDDDAHLSRRRR